MAKAEVLLMMGEPEPAFGLVEPHV